MWKVVHALEDGGQYQLIKSRANPLNPSHALATVAPRMPRALDVVALFALLFGPMAVKATARESSYAYTI